MLGVGSGSKQANLDPGVLLDHTPSLVKRQRDNSGILVHLFTLLISSLSSQLMAYSGNNKRNCNAHTMDSFCHLVYSPHHSWSVFIFLFLRYSQFLKALTKSLFVSTFTAVSPPTSFFFLVQMFGMPSGILCVLTQTKSGSYLSFALFWVIQDI